MESAGTRSKLQTVLLRVLEVESNFGQRAVANLFIECKTVVALVTQIAALWSQVRAMKE